MSIIDPRDDLMARLMTVLQPGKRAVLLLDSMLEGTGHITVSGQRGMINVVDAGGAVVGSYEFAIQPGYLVGTVRQVTDKHVQITPDDLNPSLHPGFVIIPYHPTAWHPFFLVACSNFLYLAPVLPGKGLPPIA